MELHWCRARSEGTTALVGRQRGHLFDGSPGVGVPNDTARIIDTPSHFWPFFERAWLVQAGFGKVSPMSSLARFFLSWFAVSAAVSPLIGTFLAGHHAHAARQVPVAQR